MLIYGADRELKLWAGERVGIKDFGPSATIGVAHKGKIVAAAVFSNYQWPSIQITFVTSSPNWKSKGAIKAILSFPFKQLKCRRLTAITEATNQPARAFLCRLGFHQEGYHPDSFESGDGISYGLLAKDAARWVEEKPHAVAQESGTVFPPRLSEGSLQEQRHPASGPGPNSDYCSADQIEHRDCERESHQCSDPHRLVAMGTGPNDRAMDADL